MVIFGVIFLVICVLVIVGLLCFAVHNCVKSFLDFIYEE